MSGIEIALSAIQAIFAALACTQLKTACSVPDYEQEVDDLKSSVTAINELLLSAGTRTDLSPSDLNYVQSLKEAVYGADDMFDWFLTVAELKKNGEFSNKVLKTPECEQSKWMRRKLEEFDSRAESIAYFLWRCWVRRSDIWLIYINNRAIPP